MSALQDDDLQPQLDGDLSTVDGLLLALKVGDAPLRLQALAIRRAARLPGVGPLLERLRPDLEKAGLHRAAAKRPESRSS